MLEVLEKQIKQCRLCAQTLSAYGIEPRPIFSGKSDYPIFLLGQAPGRTEYEKNAPFQGDAGKSIKSLFSECGLNNFDDVVYQTSVTKCFPGRRSSSSTDRMPSSAEVSNCLPFLMQQLELIQPKLLVCLGGLSWKAFLKMQERESPGYCSRELAISRPSDVKVTHMVGKRLQWRSTAVLPMIHPAGSANGARAAHPDLDNRSKVLLKNLLIEIGAYDL